MPGKIKINKGILVLSIFSSILCLLFSYAINANPLLSLLFVIPLMFGILYYYLIPMNVYFGPGWTVVTGIMILRYVVFTPFFVLNQYKSSVISSYDNFYILITLTVILIELLTIFLTARYFIIRNSKKNNNQFFIARNNFLFTSFIIGCSFLVVLLNPIVLLNFNFVFNSARFVELDLKTEEFIFGSGFELEMVKYGIIFFNLYVFEKYCFKYSNTFKTKYLVFSIIPIMLSALVYVGISRSSLLLPFLTYMFLIIKFYYNKIKKILPVLITYIVILMLTMTVYKQFRTDSIEKGTAELTKISFFSNFLNDYTSSFPNIYQGLINSTTYDNLINSETIANDYLSAFPVLHRFANMQNRTNVYFNKNFSSRVKESHRILPLNVQGFMHFGIFFFYIYSIITIYLILKFDHMFINSNDVYKSFVFALVAIGIGFSLGHTFTAHVLGRITKSFIPLFIIVYLNNNFKLKIK